MGTRVANIIQAVREYRSISHQSILTGEPADHDLAVIRWDNVKRGVLTCSAAELLAARLGLDREGRASVREAVRQVMA